MKDEQPYVLPAWAQDFYDKTVAFLKEKGYEIVENHREQGQVYDKPNEEGWTNPRHLVHINADTIKTLCKENYALLREYGDCPIKIEGHPVLYFYFNEEYKQLFAFVSNTWGICTYTLFETWKLFDVSNLNYPHLLTKLGYPPIL